MKKILIILSALALCACGRVTETQVKATVISSHECHNSLWDNDRITVKTEDGQIGVINGLSVTPGTQIVVYRREGHFDDEFNGLFAKP